MAIRGKVGAVYLLEAAPTTFGTEPAQMEQAGGLFLWEMDVTEARGYSFAGGRPEQYHATTGWYVEAEAFWGDDRFFAALGEMVFVRLFIEPGEKLGCLQGYAVLPLELPRKAGEINKKSIFLEGIGKPWIGGITCETK